MVSLQGLNFSTKHRFKPFYRLKNGSVILVNSVLCAILFIPQVHNFAEGNYTLLQDLLRIDAWINPPKLPTLTEDQSKIINEVIKAGKDTQRSERDIQIAITTVLQESGARNLKTGDDWFFAQTGGGLSDSVGIFQQRNLPPWNKRDRMNPYQASLTFYEELETISDRNTMPIWTAAAAVQKPAKKYEQHYQQWEDDASAIVNARVEKKLFFFDWFQPSQGKGWVRPIQGAEITSPYGMRIHPLSGVPKLHKGVDFGAAMGQPTFATRGGTVTVSEDLQDGYGIRVEIDHGDGYTSLYAHLSETLVTNGQKVKQGEVIGRAGSTGQSTGVHSHFEILQGGTPIDPLTLLEKK